MSRSDRFSLQILLFRARQPTVKQIQTLLHCASLPNKLLGFTSSQLSRVQGVLLPPGAFNLPKQ